MSIATTMDALASAGTAFATYTYAYPARQINTPAAVVGYPEIEFDLTFGRGADTLTYPVWAVIGKADADLDRATLSTIVPAGKAALDGTLGGAVDSARVTGAQVVEMAVGDVTYLAVRFDVEVLA